MIPSVGRDNSPSSRPDAPGDAFASGVRHRRGVRYFRVVASRNAAGAVAQRTADAFTGVPRRRNRSMSSHAAPGAPFRRWIRDGPHRRSDAGGRGFERGRPHVMAGVTSAAEASRDAEPYPRVSVISACRPVRGGSGKQAAAAVREAGAPQPDAAPPRAAGDPRWCRRTTPITCATRCPRRGTARGGTVSRRIRRPATPDGRYPSPLKRG